MSLQKLLEIGFFIIPESLFKQLEFYDMFLLSMFITFMFFLFGFSIRERERQRADNNYFFKKKLKNVLKDITNLEEWH